MAVTALSPADCLESKKKRALKLRLVQFSVFSSVCRGGDGERARQCVQWTSIHLVLREGFQILPLTFFWTQRSAETEVAQNWHRLPQRCQGQPLCRGVAGAQCCFFFHSHLTSCWEKEAGGSLTTRRTDTTRGVSGHTQTMQMHRAAREPQAASSVSMCLGRIKLTYLYL